MAQSFVPCLFLAIVVASSFGTATNESFVQDGANGTVVVLLSIAHLEQSAIFSDDNGLLRRIAYVETRDGSDSDTYSEGNNGGIWTKDTSSALPALEHKQIVQQFGIDYDTSAMICCL